MADSTFGVKVPEELKDQIQKMMSDSGLSGKDFMQQIINCYTVEKTKENIPEVAQDLKELQALTQRINTIYLNLGYRIESINKTQEQDKQNLLDKKDMIINNLQEQQQDLQQKNDELVNLYNNANDQNEDYLQRVKELTDSNNSIKTLNEEYKSKIDTMAGIVEEYKDYKNQIEEYKKLLADSQAKNINLDNSLKQKDISINNLNIKIDNLQQDKDRAVKELNDKHLEELQSMKDKLNLESDKAILNLKQLHQEELEKTQDRYNKQIEEYQAKYKGLLEEMEKGRAARTTKKNKNS